MSADLAFEALGPLRVRRGTSVVDLGSPKQRAVLAILLVNPNRAQSVERMIDELWSGEPPASALATLQAYVSNLRRALEPHRPARSPASVLVSRPGAYELVVDPDQVDLVAFERAATEGAALVASDPGAALDRLDTALALWRGPALIEFRSYEFAVAEMLRLDELRVNASEHRIEALLALGRSAELVAELEGLVSEHPMRERLWGQLVRAYYRAGRQAEALRAYRRCETVLADELGLVPSAELRELELAVLEHDPRLLPAASTHPAMPEPAPAVIVGRQHELGRFEGALGRARVGRGSILLVDGEPGVGKTRLLEAMHGTALAAGCQVALARCVEVGGTPPFWPWIQVVRALGTEAVLDAAGPLAGSLTPLVSEIADDAEAIVPGRVRYQVAEGLVAAMRQLGTVGPVVVLVDDLYSADADSLSALALVGAAIDRQPVVLVGSHRGSGLSSPHPLLDLLVQLTRLDWVERLSLARLSPDQVGELVRSIATHAVDDDTVRIIHERTAGNALFAVELARLLDEENPDDGVAASVPATVREVIERRLRHLPPSAMAMVRAAAVAGRTFDLAVVADAAGVPIDDALDLADVALASGFVQETDVVGVYRFSHVLTSDSVVAGLGGLRRAQLHDRVASALEDRQGTDPAHWDEIAHHRLQAVPFTGPESAVAALARAGRRAAAANALGHADQLLERRHQLVMAAPRSPARDQAELDSILDRALVWTWRDGYQTEVIRQATERMLELTRATSPDAMLDPATETGTRHGVLQALQARCSFEIVAGNVEASRAVARVILELAERNPHPYVRAVADLNACVTALHAAELDEALRFAEDGLMLLEEIDPGLTGSTTLPLGQQSLVVTHLCFSAWGHWMRGLRDQAVAELATGREVADRCSHAFSRSFQVSLECMVGVMDGSPQRVLDTLAWGERDRRTDRFEFLDASAELYRIWATGMGDDPAGAAPRLADAIVSLDEAGARVVQTVHWAMVAELELRAGKPARALDAATAGIHRSELAERFWYPELERLAACAHDRLGRPEDRDRALERARAAAEAMQCVPLLARLDLPTGARQAVVAVSD